VYRRVKYPRVSYRNRALADLIKRERIDIWFCPLIYALPLDGEIPVVITIPDLQHEAYPEFFSSDDLALRTLGYQYSCLTATAVIGISFATAADIVRLYDIDPSRVFGIQLALDEAYRVSPQRLAELKAKVRSKFCLDEGFLFYPANSWPHKNHEVLVEALGLLHRRGRKLKLVLTGVDTTLVDRLRPLLRTHHLDSAVRHLGYVDRLEILGLYCLAGILVFPSLFEGFGLPLLEAMHLGVPVACSQVGSLPEIGGDAVLYFDPRSPVNIADSITQLLDDPDLRERLVSAGYDRVRGFSYERTARQTLAVFEQIGNGSLAKPQLAPFRPLLPHNWLPDGHGRWYFRSPDLRAIVLDIVQPLSVPELAEQRITVHLNQREVLRSEIEPQRPYKFLIPVDSEAATKFFRLDVVASSIFRVHLNPLSLQVSSIKLIDRYGSELSLIQ
jgi:glycosyltransferase involved in cell wall biosynthesis